MNHDDVIRMAREAFIKRGFWPNEVMWECWKDAWIQGAAAEREACARLEYEAGIYSQYDMATAIRARGKT